MRSNGNRSIFQKAYAWCSSPEPLKRARASAILSQLRAPKTGEQELSKTSSDPIFVAESFQTLSRMLEHETDERALSSELYGLGHLGQDEAVPILVRYATHSSEEIRYAVTCSLGSFSNDAMAIESLMKLSEDSDDDIRDWSVFALASQSDADSPALRELFVRHLSDTNSDVREEAIAGLAKRKDSRAVLPLLQLMESGSYYAHHKYDFESLLGENPNGDEWGTEDFINALYARFADCLPKRD